MALKHEETCDQCKRTVSGYDTDWDYEWAGLRFNVFDHTAPRGERKVIRHDTRLPGNHHAQELNEPIDIQITQRVRTRSGSSSRTMGIVLPGLVCSPQCFTNWMAEQVARIVKEADPSLNPPPPDKRAVNLGDE